MNSDSHSVVSMAHGIFHSSRQTINNINKYQKTVKLVHAVKLVENKNCHNKYISNFPNWYVSF